MHNMSKNLKELKVVKKLSQFVLFVMALLVECESLVKADNIFTKLCYVLGYPTANKKKNVSFDALNKAVKPRNVNISEQEEEQHPISPADGITPGKTIKEKSPYLQHVAKIWQTVQESMTKGQTKAKK